MFTNLNNKSRKNVKSSKHQMSKSHINGKKIVHKHNLSYGERKAYLKNVGELEEGQTFSFQPRI